jgi:uncharacterized protein YndB with AHSA1/START domain
VTQEAPEGARVLRLERTFNAPAHVVFDAWTSAQTLRRWWPAGPFPEWDTPVAEIDVRVGGELRLVMSSPDGQTFGGRGEFVEISPPTRLVYTWTWDGESRPQVVEVDFHQHPDRTTTVVLTNRGLDDEATRREHREGWEASFDNLDRVLVAG